jgi:hypothetical protein
MGSAKLTNRLNFFTAAILLLLSWPLQAGVVARLSAPVTSLDQPVRLTLENDGETSGSPDLSVLEEDFEILGRATQQSMSIINGTISSKRSLILTLLPKREGELTIPAIPYGDELTAPLQLEVSEQTTTGDGVQQRQAWVEMSLDRESAYPEEEIILTLKLYQAAGVRGEHLDQPSLSSGDTRLQLLDESKYTIERAGQAYRVLELNYGLYAYQPGSLEIGPVAFRGRTGGASVFSLLDDPFGGSPQPSRLVSAKSNPVTLQVKPIPADFSGDHWLPARNILLVDTGVDQSQPIIAGKPITRRIMMTADGLMSSQLPPIASEAPDGIKSYEERPQVRDTPRRTGISSSRESVVTLIPTQAGQYTLPAIEIPWWNTLTGQQEVASLPELTLEVIPGTADASQSNAVTPQAQITASGDMAAPLEAASGEAERESSQAYAAWLVWLLVAIWVLTLAGWWLSHRKRRPAPDSVEPEEPPSAKADEEQLEASIVALASAYREKDAEAAREAWLAWALRRWPQQPPNNLTRLAGRCPGQVAKVVLTLEKAIYSPGMESDWASSFDPASLKSLIEGESPEQSKREELLPLNP